MRPHCSTAPIRHSISSFAALLILLFAPLCHAQIAAYGNFTAGSLGRITFDPTGARPGNVYTYSWLYGPTAGIYAEAPLKYFALGIDIRGNYLRGDKLLHWSALGGPRIEFRPESGFNPYAEILFGFGGYRDDVYSFSHREDDYAAVFGVDKKIYRIIDWRIAEFALNSYFQNRNPASKQFSTGVVIHIPTKNTQTR
jgi:hypothetical protein